MRLAALLLCTFATPAFAHDYEMKDLEALEKQEAWLEAAQHLGDIAPSKRDDKWQRIAEKSAAGVIAAAEPRASIATADSLFKTYPTLKKSALVWKARADAGLAAFAKTFSDYHHNSDDEWWKGLREFVDSDPMTADLPMRAGKLVTSRLVAYMGMPFYKKAIEKNASACKDADVKASLVSALVDGVWAEDARAAIDKSCFADVRTGIEAAFAKEKDTDNLKKNACPSFAAKKVAIAACK